MHDADIISWNKIFVWYEHNRFSKNDLDTFKEMQFLGIKPKFVTFSSILLACSTMGALEDGMDINQRVVKNGFWITVMVVNALIGMY